MNKERFCQYCQRLLLGSKSAMAKHLAKCERKLVRKFKKSRS
jgi:hypothetical protein